MCQKFVNRNKYIHGLALSLTSWYLLSLSKNSPALMEPKCSSLSSQPTSTGPCLDQMEPIRWLCRQTEESVVAYLRHQSAGKTLRKIWMYRGKKSKLIVTRRHSLPSFRDDLLLTTKNISPEVLHFERRRRATRRQHRLVAVLCSNCTLLCAPPTPPPAPHLLLLLLLRRAPSTGPV